MKHPIYTEFNLDAKVGVSNLIAVTHTDDRNADVLEVSVRQNGVHIDLTGATAIARMVLHREKDYLLSDNVPCTINANGNILIPFDNAVVKTRQGTVKIEVSISRDEDRLTLQFPLWVSVKGSVLDSAEVTPDSEGTIPELLEEAKEALDDATEALEKLGSYDNLVDKPQINGVTLSGNQTSEALGLQNKLTAGDNVSIDASGRISAKDTNNYNELTNRPQIQINGQSSPLSGTLVFNLDEFIADENVDINLKWNIFKSYLLPTSDISYNFNLLLKQVQHTGVYRIKKTKALNIPQIFSDAGEILHIYHFLSAPAYGDLIRAVLYETTDGPKIWMQMAQLNGIVPQSGAAQLINATKWVDLTNTGGSEIASGIVNQNGTISFYDADGNLLFTTTGASVIGPRYRTARRPRR